MLKFRWLSTVLSSPSRKGLILLTGARQTGKTTLFKKVYGDQRYFNLDAPDLREELRSMPTALWAAEVGPAIFDEAQKEPSIFEKVKYAYDAGSLSWSALLGSSQILLLKQVRETLAGRIRIFELWPLMMSEIAAKEVQPSKPPLLETILRTQDIANVFSSVPSRLLLDENAYALQAENYLLHWGGMPALLLLTETERWAWLRDYETTYLERDLADLARLHDLQPFHKFQKLAALRTGGLLNYSELARDAGVGVDTARRYLEYLRLSYQTILLQPFAENVTSSTIKTPKLYWMDIGLWRHLTGFRGELSGALYETLVVSEIKKWLSTMQREAALYFYRTKSGLEIDLIIELPAGLIAIEIKSRAQVSEKDCRSIQVFSAHLKSKPFLGGLVIYQGLSLEKIAEPNIWAVPSRRLLVQPL